MNDFQQLDYGVPCPPSGTHRRNIAGFLRISPFSRSARPGREAVETGVDLSAYWRLLFRREEAKRS